MITEKIKKIFFIIKNDVNQKMKPYNLTAAQILLLKYLNKNSGEMVIQKNICDYLSLKHSTVIGILKRLEDKGYSNIKDRFDDLSLLFIMLESIYF